MGNMDEVEPDGEPTGTRTLALRHVPLPEPRDVSLQQLCDVTRQIKELIRFVDSAREAALLVRRASAVEQLLDEALKSYHTLEAQQFDLKQDAAETHLRTQRRAGELLQQVAKHPGGRPRAASAGNGRPPAARVPTLKQLGIDGHESHRWQRIASIPPEAFEEYIVACRRRRKELTRASVMAFAHRLQSSGDESNGASDTPSNGRALLREYEAAVKGMSEIVWLDPIKLASAMPPAQRYEELARSQRLRAWLNEFDSALQPAAGARSD